MQQESPLQLGYIKTIRFFLRPSGSWPSDVFEGYLPLPIRIHRATLPFHTTIIVMGGLYYITDNFHRLSFLDMGHMIITTFLAMVTALRSILPNLQTYNSLLCKFIQEFHLMHHAYKGDYFEEVNKTVDKISSYCTKFSTIIMYLAILFFNITPTYNNIRHTLISKTENYSMEYSVYFSFPGFNPLDHFASTTVYNIYLSYNCSTLFCGFDLLLFLMIFQIIGHVYILRHNLENFQSPKNKITLNLRGDALITNNTCTYEVFDAQENEEVRLQLAECIEHHKIIIGFTDDVSGLYGPLLAFNYFFHMIACCLLLLECTEGSYDAVLRYGPLTILVFGQLIQMSVMFELLGSETEKLKDSAYCLPWEAMNTSNQRTAFIMLHKMQYKISLKALGLAAVGVNTMVGILKTTFSYYAFLQTMGDR
uniref:Odorant receptor n=2 Tax=Ostrinia furnacalis TaxID=93504 RepID=J3SFR7_OSTFU|nr:odorant receptor 6 [Ostrinia furnacalis]BAR43448.1 olfactory receptor 6 [Ostrinia furnacalis]